MSIPIYVELPETLRGKVEIGELLVASGVVAANAVKDLKENIRNFIGGPMKFDNEDMEYLKAYMPDIITDENTIDVFALVTKTQRMVNKFLLDEYKNLIENNTLQTLQDLVSEAENKYKFGRPSTNTNYWKTMAEKMNKISYYNKSNDSSTNTSNVSPTLNSMPSSSWNSDLAI
jgi:uncharacterized protein YbjQ (UPF0145 family)